jgi:hypothetical protein
VGPVIRKKILPLLCLLTIPCVSSAASLVMAVGDPIGDPKSALAPLPGPYANVTVTLGASKTQAQILVSGANEAVYDYLLGGADAVDLNVNGSFRVVNAFSVVNGSGGMTSIHPIGGFDITTVSATSTSGFGNFNLSIKNFDAFSNPAFSIGFMIQNTTGTWASENSVLAANAAGFIAALHIAAYNPSCGPNPCATGFVALDATPEPGSLLLTGIGFLSLILLVRRRNSGRLDRQAEPLRE